MVISKRSFFTLTNCKTGQAHIRQSLMLIIQNRFLNRFLFSFNFLFPLLLVVALLVTYIFRLPIFLFFFVHFGRWRRLFWRLLFIRCRSCAAFRRSLPRIRHFLGFFARLLAFCCGNLILQGRCLLVAGRLFLIGIIIIKQVFGSLRFWLFKKEFVRPTTPEKVVGVRARTCARRRRCRKWIFFLANGCFLLNLRRSHRTCK
mmetsp:Transcript_1834/g.2461  ORF Transcript_1834/g.2461 Transcript_1834/m.2461 type:complete len:202 (+) Transcript_1834:207-812(+)